MIYGHVNHRGMERLLSLCLFGIAVSPMKSRNPFGALLMRVE